jgi:hypothetical protein
VQGVCTNVNVADHQEQLESIQAKLLADIEASLDVRVLEDGRVLVPTDEDKRIALAVLKHNGITSSIGDSQREKLKAKISSNIDSSRIRDKRRLVALPSPPTEGAA